MIRRNFYYAWNQKKETIARDASLDGLLRKLKRKKFEFFSGNAKKSIAGAGRAVGTMHLKMSDEEYGYFFRHAPKAKGTR